MVPAAVRMLGISADGRPVKTRQSFVAPGPFADGDQSDGEQRAKRDANAGADETLLDRIANQKYAAERQRYAADPDDPARAEPLLKTDRSRRRRGGAGGIGGGRCGGSGGGAAAAAGVG